MRWTGLAGFQATRAVALSLSLWFCAAPALASGPEIGGYAPEIELTDTGGTPRKVSWGEKGSPATVVYFFDPQSPECLLEMSFLDALSLRGRDFGLAVYAVEARGRQPAEVSRSMERYCAVYREPSFPVLPDPSFRAGRTYGVGRIPVTFVTESHGVILNRIEGYDHSAAVAIVRRVEQMLRRERGFFSPVLREAGVTEAEEREAEARAAAAAVKKPAPAAPALGAGDRVQALGFTDAIGRSIRWEWGEGKAPPLRVLAFLEGLSLTSVAELRWLDELMRRGRDAGLEVIAVEVGGMDAAALGAALERYRRVHPELSFPVVLDPGRALAGVFGSFEQLPQTYLLAPDGTIIHREEGFIEDKAPLMGAKIERAFVRVGRTFPPPRGAAGPAAGSADTQAPADEEAPSIRKKREQDERHRSSIVQGDALYMSWEFERALPHYLAALEIQPRDLHALVRAAKILERLGQRQRALEHWDRVLVVQPDNAEARERAVELRLSR